MSKEIIQGKLWRLISAVQSTNQVLNFQVILSDGKISEELELKSAMDHE